MICANCGFQNAPGDEFCGSCGQFLAWAGAPADSTSAADGAGAAAPPPAGPDSPTILVPPPPSDSGSWPAPLQRCDVCGTANELSRTFCLKCGARLKTTGTTTGTALAVAAARAERQRNTRTLLYALGGASVLVLGAVVGFVAFGGLSPSAQQPSTAPLASLIAVNPSAALPPVASQPAVTAPASFEPMPTVSATALTTQFPATVPPATVPPATAPPAAGVVCSASTFSATQPGNWKLLRARWSRKGPTDTLYLEMQASSSTSTASVDANILAPDQVQATYGVPGPSSGDVALVLAFNDAVRVGTPFGSPVGYKALKEFQIVRNAGRVLVVMGVNGAGCYGLSSSAWTASSAVSPELAVALPR